MAILRGVNSRLLPCGCLFGVYETYTGQTVSILDAKGKDCRNAAHRVNEQVGDKRAPDDAQITLKKP